MRDRNYPLLIGGNIVLLITLGPVWGYLLSTLPRIWRGKGSSPPIQVPIISGGHPQPPWQGSRIAVSGGRIGRLGCLAAWPSVPLPAFGKDGAVNCSCVSWMPCWLSRILLAMALAAVLGPGQSTVILALGLGTSRFLPGARAAVLVVEKEQFVLAARVLGAGTLHIWWRHILPNGLPSLLAQASLSFATAIIVEAGLSFLGLGTQPPLASWGRMLSEARDYMGVSPWMALFPGLALAITVLGFNLLGEGIRRALNPRRR